MIPELKKEGVDVQALPMAFKLVVNTQPTDPLSIGYKRVGELFEIRGLDAQAAPLAVKGDAGNDDQINLTRMKPPPRKIARLRNPEKALRREIPVRILDLRGMQSAAAAQGHRHRAAFAV